MTDSSGGGLSKIVLSVDDFLNCGWKEALDAADIHHYSTMHVAFEEAARRAFEAGREAEGKVLRLFSDACSMMFDFPTNKTHPFKPNAKVYRGGQCYRSPLSEDFSDSDLKFLAEIARLEEMDDPRLKARLSDIVWIEKRPAGISYHEHALNAIKNYRAVPLDPKHPSSDAKDCWIRAVELSHMLNKKRSLLRSKAISSICLIRSSRRTPISLSFLQIYLNRPILERVMLIRLRRNSKRCQAKLSRRQP